MTSPEIIALLEEKFGTKIKGKDLEAIDPFAIVEPANLFEVCTFLRDDPRLQFDLLNCITGVDYLETDKAKALKAGFDPHLECGYHFSSFVKKHRFVLKIILPRWRDNVEGQLPEVPSVVSLWPAADWHERETYDLCGIMFTGHPDLRRILLADDWEGHPLRKDYIFPLEYHGIRGR
jgi:NADH-quinone oxidoreductase subunit C